MSKTDEELVKEIREMAHLTILSGRINEVQEKNLSMYPLVYFNGVSAVKMDYDLLQTKAGEESPVSNNSRISYYLTIDESQPNANIERRFAVLAHSVRNLLWNDIYVTVHFNGRVVFASRNDGRKETVDTSKQ